MSGPYERRENESQAEVIWHQTHITKDDRAKQKDQTPKCIWLTGLSGSGKSTLLRCINWLERPDSGRILIDKSSAWVLRARWP